jgi:peptide/nickel transport system substrate-binding protein
MPMRSLLTGFAAATLVFFCLAEASLAAGSLKVSVDSNLNTLDPAKMKGGQEYVFAFLVFSGLTRADHAMKLQPDLAESWESSADLKTWTFHLRHGVKFHNGHELEAEDVVATITRLQDKAIGSTARVNFEIISAIKAPDRYTVVFELRQSYAGFAELFSERQARILAKDSIADIATKPVGTGPFMFASFDPGDKIVLKRNPDYFEAGLPKLDEVVIRILPESAAQVAALTTGELDLVWGLPLESIEKIKASPNLVVDSVATSTWDGIIMNNDVKPFNDILVRQAIAAAIDKKQMVDIALFGNGTPTHTPIPPSHPYFDASIPILKADIAKAKKLLIDAGYPNGFDIVLQTPVGRPTRERLGLAVREMLKPIGIRVDIQRVPYDVFLKDVEGKAAFYIDGFYSRPTVDTSVYPWYHSKGSWNTGLWHFNDPKMDEILDGARLAPGEAEAKRLYSEFQSLAVKDVPGVIPYVVNHINGINKRVIGFHSHPMLILDLSSVSVSQ